MNLQPTRMTVSPNHVDPASSRVLSLGEPIDHLPALLASGAADAALALECPVGPAADNTAHVLMEAAAAAADDATAPALDTARKNSGPGPEIAHRVARRYPVRHHARGSVRFSTLLSHHQPAVSKHTQVVDLHEDHQ